MDYKSQVAKLREFVNCNYPIEFVLSAILLIGYLNDGISNKEIDWLSLEMQDNYGLEAVFTLEKLIKFKMIRVIHGSSVDFFSSLGFTSQRKSPQPTASLNLKMTKMLGSVGVEMSSETTTP